MMAPEITDRASEVVGRGILVVGRHVNVDRLDSWSEASLGMCATCLFTAAILLCVLPLFDVGGLAWLRSLEAISWNTSSTTSTTLDVVATVSISTRSPIATASRGRGARVSFSSFRKNILVSFPGFESAFQHMHHGFSNYSTVEDFKVGTAYFKPQLSPAQLDYAFHGFDENCDHMISIEEWTNAFHHGCFYHWSNCSRIQETSYSALAPDTLTVCALKSDAIKWAGSMKRACEKIDRDGSGRISIDEFNASGSIHGARTHQDILHVFKAMDRDGDAVISQGECYRDVLELEAQLELLGSPDAVASSLDVNGGGAVGIREFISLGELLDPKVGEVRMADLFCHLDKNRNQKIEIVEFPKSDVAHSTSHLRPAAMSQS